jgi:hypothetical protein
MRAASATGATAEASTSRAATATETTSSARFAAPEAALAAETSTARFAAPETALAAKTLSPSTSIAAAEITTPKVAMSAVIEIPSKPASIVPTVSTVPGARPDKESVGKPIRTVVAIRRTLVRVISVIPVRAVWSRTHVGWAYSKTKRKSLCMRE